MITNRRTVRITIVAAILVLLFAGIVGELTFGSRGPGRSALAEAATVTNASAAAAADGAHAADAHVASATDEDQGDSGSDTESVPTSLSAPDASPTVDSTSGAPSGGSVGSVAALESAPEVMTIDPIVPAESPDGPGRCPAGDADDRQHSHCVDDHAVEHSDQHGPDEAVAHGNDEEAHEKHHA